MNNVVKNGFKNLSGTGMFHVIIHDCVMTMTMIRSDHKKGYF